MTKWSLAAWLFLTCPSFADTVLIRQGEVFKEVLYNNSGNQVSRNQTHTLELGSVVVDVEIRVSTKEETVTVRPHGPGVIADPASADVLDGDYIVIRLIEPMF